MRSILIDNRTGSKELLAPIAGLGMKCKLAALDYGDFCFEGNGPDGINLLIGVERKQLGDMLSSMREGRLSGHQLIGMSQMYDRQYLIIEGQYAPDKDGILECYVHGRWGRAPGRERFTYREITNYVNTLEEMTNVRVQRTRNAHDTAHTVVDTYFYWQKQYDAHRSHLAYHKGPIVLYRPNVRERMIKELTGLGHVKAKAAGRKFKSVRKFANAGLEEWLEIEGIGAGMARKIIAEIIKEG